MRRVISWGLVGWGVGANGARWLGRDTSGKSELLGSQLSAWLAQAILAAARFLGPRASRITHDELSLRSPPLWSVGILPARWQARRGCDAVISLHSSSFASHCQRAAWGTCRLWVEEKPCIARRTGASAGAKGHYTATWLRCPHSGSITRRMSYRVERMAAPPGKPRGIVVGDWWESGGRLRQRRQWHPPGAQPGRTAGA